MAYDDTTKHKVRAKYVNGLPLDTAAKSCKVPYNTARNWKRAAKEAGEDWDLMRTARRMTSSGAEELTNQVLGELAEQFLATIQMLKADKAMSAAQRAQILMQLGDSYSKAMAAASRAAPNTNRLATVMDAQRFMAEQVKKLAPKFHTEFLRVLEASGSDLVREFGGAR